MADGNTAFVNELAATLHGLVIDITEHFKPIG